MIVECREESTNMEILVSQFRAYKYQQIIIEISSSKSLKKKLTVQVGTYIKEKWYMHKIFAITLIQQMSVCLVCN